MAVTAASLLKDFEEYNVIHLSVLKGPLYRFEIDGQNLIVRATIKTGEKTLQIREIIRTMPFGEEFRKMVLRTFWLHDSAAIEKFILQIEGADSCLTAILSREAALYNLRFSSEKYPRAFVGDAWLVVIKNQSVNVTSARYNVLARLSNCRAGIINAAETVYDEIAAAIGHRNWREVIAIADAHNPRAEIAKLPQPIAEEICEQF